MGNICQITGARQSGRQNPSQRFGQKGGIGRHVTKHIKRWIYPNIHKKRIFVRCTSGAAVEITCRA